MRLFFSPLSQTHKILLAKVRAQEMLAMHSTSFQHDLYTECTSLCFHWGCTRWSKVMLLTHFDAVKYYRQAERTKQWAQQSSREFTVNGLPLGLVLLCEFCTFPEHPSAYSQRVLNQKWDGHKLRNDVNCQAVLN